MAGKDKEEKKKKNELDELSNAIGNMFESLDVEAAGKSFKPPEPADTEAESEEIPFKPPEIKHLPPAPPPVSAAPEVSFEGKKPEAPSKPAEPPLPEEAPHAVGIADLLAGYEKKTLKEALKKAEEIVPPIKSVSAPEAPVKKIEPIVVQAPKKLEPPRQSTPPPAPSSSTRGGMAPLFAPQMDTIKPTIKGAEGPKEERVDKLKRIERPPEASIEELRKVKLRAELEELKREILAEQEPESEIVTKTSTGLEFTEKFKDLSVRSEFKAKNFYQRAMPAMIAVAALAILYFIYQLNPGVKDAVNGALLTIVNYIRLGLSNIGGS